MVRGESGVRAESGSPGTVYRMSSGTVYRIVEARLLPGFFVCSV